MAPTTSFHETTMGAIRETVLPGRGRRSRQEKLRTELTRQRAALIERVHLSLLAELASDVQPDLIDQASTELEQDIAIHVQTRTFDRLRRIEQALQLIRINDYGRCLRCRAAIPHERLKVQPDATYCVPCLTLVEQQAARN